MSVDILVFDKSKAPTEPMEFLKWFYKKSQWTSDRDYILTDFYNIINMELPLNSSVKTVIK